MQLAQIHIHRKLYRKKLSNFVFLRTLSTSTCPCLSYLPVCALPFRLDTIVGPQTLSNKAKTFSSPSLHLYYSQAKRKHSAPGSADPQSPTPKTPFNSGTNESIAEAMCLNFQ